MLSWVQDDPSYAGNSVLRYIAGGGSVNYALGHTYNSTTGEFSPERQNQAVLVRLPATGPLRSYELRNPDGSKHIFAHLDGATSSPRRIFLTQIVDAVGNALVLHYDAQLRLTTLTDATGRNTTLSYENSNNPLLVTRITDPFGRHADLVYDSQGRLSSITDVIGLTSSFSYDAAGLVNGMTTPYGSSRFVYGNGPENSRYLETTDPLGFSDRLEFRHAAPQIAASDSVIPAGLALNNEYLQYRNTFYWDKNIYPITHSDYTKAYITHWLHNPASQTSPLIESTKSPLERRVWRTYPAQSVTYREGSVGTPISISRVLDDGSTQITRFTYNRFGKPLTITDPIGRVTRYTYDSNDINLLRVEQKTSDSSYATLGSFTYNAQHLPLTYTDAAGQRWSFSYNSAGQLACASDPLGANTCHEYDPLGYLLRTVNANGQTAVSYSYDGFGRIASRTDSEGHSLYYDHDDFDRLTTITYPDGTFYRYVWDKLDLASVTDRLGRSTHYGYDANRRLTTVTDALGRTTTYGYDPNGALNSLTDANGNVTTWTRDLQGRVTAKTYADGSGLSYAYEHSTSRLAAITDALQQVQHFSYTLDDRPAGYHHSQALQATPAVTYRWDPYFPRLSGMNDGQGDTVYHYKAPNTPGTPAGVGRRPLPE